MAEQDNPVFYKLVNSVTGHYYLGATSTPIERERAHIARIRAGKKPKLWQQMWNDHPQTRNPAVWRMHIVRCYPDMEAAVQCEHAFLQARVKKDPLCLNQLKTPDAVTGPITGGKHSGETRANLSAAMSGENNPMYGKPGTMTGKKLSPETRAKLSAAQSGENNPRGFKGKTHSPETIAKMKAAAKLREARKRAKRDSGAA